MMCGIPPPGLPFENLDDVALAIWIYVTLRQPIAVPRQKEGERPH